MFDHNGIAHHVTTAVVKTSPPIAAAVATLAGLQLQAWVYIAAIVYTVLQSVHLVWTWVREWRARHETGK